MTSIGKITCVCLVNIFIVYLLQEELKNLKLKQAFFRIMCMIVYIMFYFILKEKIFILLENSVF